MSVTTLHQTIPASATVTRDERCARAQRLLECIEDPSFPQAERCRHDAVLLSLDLADMVARRYSGRGIEDDDLVQVARLALIRAVHGYRPGRGSSFAAYAVPTISGELKRYFRDKGWAVRPPRRLQERRVQVLTSEEALRHELRREPTRAEIAERLGISPAELDETRACFTAYQALSIDAPTNGREGPMELRAEAVDEAEGLALSDALARAMRGLSERDQTIVRLRFVQECTQSEIGAALGVSQMQVSRLLTAILGRLRCSIESAA